MHMDCTIRQKLYGLIRDVTRDIINTSVNVVIKFCILKFSRCVGIFDHTYNESPLNTIGDDIIDM